MSSNENTENIDSDNESTLNEVYNDEDNLDSETETNVDTDSDIDETDSIIDTELNDTDTLNINLDDTDNIFITKSLDEKKDTNIVEPKDRITIPRLTKYERVRLLGDRAKQLSEGAKSLIKTDRKISAMETARLELDNGVIPLKIIRTRPDGKIEIWSINELDIE